MLALALTGAGAASLLTPLSRDVQAALAIPLGWALVAATTPLIDTGIPPRLLTAATVVAGAALGRTCACRPADGPRGRLVRRRRRGDAPRLCRPGPRQGYLGGGDVRRRRPVPLGVTGPGARRRSGSRRRLAPGSARGRASRHTALGRSDAGRSRGARRCDGSRPRVRGLPVDRRAVRRRAPLVDVRRSARGARAPGLGRDRRRRGDGRGRAPAARRHQLLDSPARRRLASHLPSACSCAPRTTPAGLGGWRSPPRFASLAPWPRTDCRSVGFSR